MFQAIYLIMDDFGKNPWVVIINTVLTLALGAAGYSWLSLVKRSQVEKAMKIAQAVGPEAVKQLNLWMNDHSFVKALLELRDVQTWHEITGLAMHVGLSLAKF